MKKLSVVVPVYNLEDYLIPCVDSILAQDYPDMEILLVDNGSADRSLEICREYAAKDARIRVLREEKKGASYARNAGLRAATGEYLTLVDGDDFILPGSFSGAAAILPGCDAVSFPARYLFPDGTEQIVVDSITDEVDHAEFLRRVFEDTDLFIWHRIYDAGIIRDHAIFFDETITYAEDLEWLCRVSLHIKKARYSPEGGYFYRRNRPGSAVYAMFSPKDEHIFDRAIRGYKKASDDLKEAGDPAWVYPLQRSEWHRGRKREWLRMRNGELTPHEFEEKLLSDGSVIYPFHGGSMKPVLSEKRCDLVMIRKKEGRLGKYDLALYRDDGKYVLHRVVYAEPGGYLIRGDHRSVTRYVEEERVIGVLESFHRRGDPPERFIPADGPLLKLFGMIRVFIHR